MRTQRFYLLGSSLTIAAALLFASSASADTAAPTPAPSAAAAPSTAATARGVVYDDANGNGTRDAGEAGLPGVRVSNGAEVVATDASGAYTLPAPDNSTIFVLKPRDWEVRRDALRINRSYYRHFSPIRTGVPPMPPIPATDPLPASLDFGLRRAAPPAPAKFDALLIGDPQVRDPNEVAYVAHDIVEPLAGTFGGTTNGTPALAVVLGDLCFDNLAMHAPLAGVFAQLGLPMVYVRGNHDTDYAAADEQHATDHYQQVFGPTYYALDYGSVHFIVLNDVVWHGKQGDKAGGYEGGLGPRQLEFVRNDLAGVPVEQPVVFMMHIPMQEIAEHAELFKLLAARPHVTAFCGHTHDYNHWFLGAGEGWTGAEPLHVTAIGAACGAWWSGPPDETGVPIAMMGDGTPNGWAVLHWDGSAGRVEFRAARRPADYQMNIYAPDVVRAAEAAAPQRGAPAPAAPLAAEVDVLVNVFAGSARSKVELRVGDGAWAPLKRTPTKDPALVAMKAAEKAGPPLRHPTTDPGDCPHMWGGKLPAGLTPGTYTIEVRTTDCYGQTYTARRVIRVE